MTNLSGPQIATMFQALNDPTRLQIFQLLAKSTSTVAVKKNGLVHNVRCAGVEDIRRALTLSGKPSADIPLHIRELKIAGVIDVRQQGPHVICFVNEDAMEAIASFLAYMCHEDDEDKKRMG